VVAEIPQTRFVRSGEVDLAYQVFGAGDDMVAIPGLPSHLEVMWELPELAAFLDRLASFRRVITFDKRGTGMSDPVPGVPALEEQVDDIITVMDAAGSARACVAGWADGAFMAAMFAATYPQRVSAVVLGGLWLKALAGRPETLTPDPDMAKLLADRIGPLWRQGALAEVLAPSYADDQRFRSWWRRWEVYSATPAAAAGLLSWAATFDPAPILPAIQAPTLVLERAVAYHDQESRRLAAAQIPGAGLFCCPARTPCRTWGTPTRPLMRSRSSSPGRAAPRYLTGAWPRSCSPTSSAPRTGPGGSATAGGGTCWRTITRTSAGCLSGSAAWRSTRPGTASSPPSTARRGPSVAHVPSAMP
jgi:pimeloyl-ACP methyl ester carboxylesterase